MGENVTAALPLALPGVRADIPKLFASWGFVRGAEVGVASGRFSRQLCAANPHLDLICVDAWTLFPDYVERKGSRLVTQADLDAAKAQAYQRLGACRCTILEMPSVEAARSLPDESLDFVYIDANHQYHAVRADLDAWIPKVRSGGVIAGHDYSPVPYHETYGVVQAVQEVTADLGVDPWFVLDENFLWVKA